MKPRSVFGSISWCHICGLMIPDSIVSPGHSLYGTVDHVVPLSLGGQNKIENRRAAHRMCNSRKAHHDVEALDRFGLQGAVKSLLAKIGIKIDHTALGEARRRIGINPDTNRGRGVQHGIRRSIRDWENEGGAVTYYSQSAVRQ
jgi:HNH endonuclease